MKYIWQTITLLLAAVVIILSANMLVNNEQDTQPTISQEDAIIHSIMTRSSVRSYTNQQIEPEKIERILRAGMAAPTAGNRQPWEFYVVTDTTLITQFTKVTKYAAPMNSAALTAIIVCGNPSKSFPEEPLYWVQDCSAASENILLTAHAMGLGAVWCGVYPGEERVTTLKEILNIPAELTPLNIIMMGYPATDATIKDKWKPEKVHYIN